jgi:hypothetical protein
VPGLKVEVVRMDAQFNKRVASVLAPGLTARLGTPRLLHYSVPPEAALGIPAHVRAASAIRRVGSRLVIVQDDVNALARLDADGTLEPILLPPGDGGARVFDDARGNKSLKMDLESAVVLPDGSLVGFGSGASPMRERLVHVDSDLSPEIRGASALYVPMRAHCGSMGAELNIEGAVIHKDRLRLFQRSTGRRSRSARAGGAIYSFDLPAFLCWLRGEGPVPVLDDVLEVDLGHVGGLPLGFTDAAVDADGRIAFLACAEDSEDARSDGPVLTCRFGWLDEDGLRMTEVLGFDGRPTHLKLEGLEPRLAEHGCYDVVADMDLPEEPAMLLELRVSE